MFIVMSSPPTCMALATGNLLMFFRDRVEHAMQQVGKSRAAFRLPLYGGQKKRVHGLPFTNSSVGYGGINTSPSCR